MEVVHRIHTRASRNAVTEPISVGRVLSAENRSSVEVECDQGAVTATVAYSCLTAPEVGDRVLVARIDASAELVVFAILDRPEAAETRLRVDGGLAIDAAGGVRIQSEGATVEVGAGAVGLEAEEVRVVSKASRWATERLSVVAREASSYIDDVQHAGRRVAVFGERLEQQFDEAIKKVTGVDHASVGTMVREVDGLLRTTSKTALQSAKKLMKFAAEQVHLG